MKKHFKNFIMKRGILYRRVEDGDSVREQLVVPEVYRKDVLKGAHTDIGHPGRDKTLRLLRGRLF